jgi:hypothetical protein
MVAVYFILTQWLQGQNTVLGHHLSFHLWNVKYIWDHLFSADVPHGGLVKWLSQDTWNTDRHVIRPYMEALMAALLWMQLGANPVKFIRTHQRVSAWRELTLPFVIFVMGAIIALVGFAVILPLEHRLVHESWLQVQLGRHPGIAQKLYADGYDAVILGLIAGLIVHLTGVAKPVMAANMAYFCRRWIGKDRSSHWWMPKGMRAGIAYLHAQPAELVTERAAASERWFGFVVTGLFLLFLALVGYGVYILVVIA